MNTLTREAVNTTARALMMLNGGKTTTLEVKQALRKLGYWAEQADVRNFMLDITSKDSDIQYQDNGQYREYSIDMLVTTTPTPQPVSGFMHSPHMPLIINPPLFPAKVHRDNVKANYLVTDEFGWNKARFNDVTRAEAKAKWAKFFNRPYAQARTKKES